MLKDVVAGGGAVLAAARGLALGFAFGAVFGDFRGFAFTGFDTLLCALSFRGVAFAACFFADFAIALCPCWSFRAV